MDLFADQDLDQREWEHDKKVQKVHGRLEVREIWKSTQMNEWFEKEWSNVAQVMKIRRWVKKGEEEREEIVYALTNLPRAKAGAKRLLEINQKHRSIENRLHYRRDVTLGEDARPGSEERMHHKHLQLSRIGLLFVMSLHKCDISALILKKQFNCFLRSSHGKTGTPKSLGTMWHAMYGWHTL